MEMHLDMPKTAAEIPLRILWWSLCLGLSLVVGVAGSWVHWTTVSIQEHAETIAVLKKLSERQDSDNRAILNRLDRLLEQRRQ